MSTGHFSIQTAIIDSIDCLRQPISDADVEIVQLGRGQLHGTLTKAVFEDLAFSTTEFSVPIRTLGMLGTKDLTICMMLERRGKSASWGRELHQGDVFLVPPGRYLDGVFGENTQVAGISIDPARIAANFTGEPIVSDVAYWMKTHQHACEPRFRSEIAGRVLAIASAFEQCAGLSDDAADFWQRSLIEAFTAPFVRSLAASADKPISSALRLVRDVEQHVKSHSHRAVHVSEICTAFGVSRRTLHRAFHDVLGIGPIAFLRHHRLCSIHARLRRGAPGQVHVTDVATEFGFLELGRFAHYYLSLFGEYPSQTLYRNARAANVTAERGARGRSA
jgi:AraC-like DNA-binding protein